jgi:hypothetical protein
MKSYFTVPVHHMTLIEQQETKFYQAIESAPSTTNHGKQTFLFEVNLWRPILIDST